jgi:YHS domain-containing protein
LLNEIKTEIRIMKLLLKTTLVVLTPLAFLSCNKDESAAPSQTTDGSEAETSVTPYPLKTCLVSGEDLGSMGDPYVIIHEGQEIKFCCDNCEPKFKKDPAKYLAMLKTGSSAEMPDHKDHNH